jgi:hypothetical protein
MAKHHLLRDQRGHRDTRPQRGARRSP